MANEKPTSEEERLMVLLNLPSVEALNEWLTKPDNQQALAQMSPPDEQYELQEKQDEENDQIQDLEHLYGMSQPPE